MVVTDEEFLALKTQVEVLDAEVGLDPSGIYPTVEARVDAISNLVDSLLDTNVLPLAGDLSGTTIVSTVIGLQNRPISNLAPSDGYVLTWKTSDGHWKPMPVIGGGIFTANGDLSGSSSSQNVIKIQNQAVSATSPTSGHALMWNGSAWISTAPATSLSVGGDLSGTTASSTVIALRGVGVVATTPTTNQALIYNGTNWAPTTIPAQNPSLGGDLSGTTSSAIVSKINGTTVPAGGSLVTGTILRATSVSTLAYGALDLANSSAVTGVLPIANHPDATTGAKGIAQLAGDLGGTASSPTTLKINSASVPVAGALVTGNGLYVTGTSALSYSALNLSGGSSYVIGVLPNANLPDSTTGAKGIVQLAGDLGGTAALPTTLKINSASVPVAGALVTGTILRVTGTSALGYGALDLANSSAVTGILPSANLFQATTGTSGVVRLTGDLGGTAALPTVVDLTVSGEANGSLIYFNGTNWVNRAAGTANYILTANGAAAPTWNNSITAMTGVRSNSFAIDQTAGGTNAKSEIYHDYFTTISNTQYTARTITAPISKALLITVCLWGTDNFTGYGGTKRTLHVVKAGKYYRDSTGGVILSGTSTVQNLTPTWGESPTIDLSFVISTNDVLIKVTGEATYNAKWHMETCVRFVDT